MSPFVYRYPSFYGRFYGAPISNPTVAKTTLPYPIPSFRWTSCKHTEDITLEVDFKDGGNHSKAILVPGTNFAVKKVDSNNCSLVGSLEDEPNSLLAVVGCACSDDMLVIIP